MRGLSKEQTEAQMSNLKQLLFLDVHSNKKAKFLSGGNKRKLCCAMALISKPDLIFMDEFQNGVDPMSRKNLYTYLKTLKDTATLIVTHYIDEAEKICDKIAIMHRGKFLELDTPNNLKEKHGTVFIL
jgi:ABC-2 type transport system ATP-binding protein